MDIYICNYIYIYIPWSHERVPMGRAPYKSVNHERVPMSCLPRFDAFKANNWTNNIMYNAELPALSKSSPDGTQHSERYHVTVSMV